MLEQERLAWQILLENGEKSLSAGHPSSKKTTLYIGLITRPSFQDETHFGIEVYAQKALWFLSTWHKTADYQKILNPVEGLKYIGKIHIPTLQHESGDFPLEKVQIILDKISTSILNPNFDLKRSIFIDGISNTLIIKNGYTTYQYTWHSGDEAKTALDEIANLINEMLPSSTSCNG